MSARRAAERAEMDRSAEDDVLLYLLGAPGCRAGGAPAELLARADWDRVVDASIRHGVAALLHKRISALKAASAIPAAARRRLRGVYLRSGARSLRLFHDLSAVLSALGDDGIRAIVLKGAHLGPIVYGDVAVRQMGDLDILIDREDLPGAEQAFRRLGCTLGQRGDRDRDWLVSRHFHLCFRSPGQTAVEVHWDLAPPSAASRIDLAGIWQRARTVRVADVQTLALSPEDLLLHLCLHSANHGHAWGLKAVCDVAEVLSHFGDSLDWGAFLDRCRDSRIDRAACWALLAARRMLAADVPSGVLARLKLDTLEPRLVETLCAYVLEATAAPGRSGDAGHWQSLDSLGSARNGRERASLLLRHIFPPVRRIRYLYDLPPGAARAYAYYLIRPLDLARRWGPNLLAWAFGTRRARQGLDRAKARGALLRALADEPPPRRPGRAPNS
jgi:hypothetical protein